MKSNKKKNIFGLVTKLGTFINKTQPGGKDLPKQKLDEDPKANESQNTPKKDEEKNFNLQIEDDIDKAEYDLNDDDDDDDDEEDEEEEDNNEQNEEENGKNEKEKNEESTNDSISEKNNPQQNKNEVKKEEIKEEKKIEEKVEEMHEEKVSEKVEEKKKEKVVEKVEEKHEEKVAEKVEEKKEEKKEEDKEDKKEDKKVEKKEEIKKEEKKENIINNEKEDIKEEKKIENNEKNIKGEIDQQKDGKPKEEEKPKESEKSEDTEKKPKKKKTKKKSTKEKENPENTTTNKSQEDKPQEKKEKKSTTKKYINAILAKAEKELFKPTPKQKAETPQIKKRQRIKQTKISDNNKICHFFLKKGTDININEYEIYPIQKVKKQGGVLSKFNLNIKIGGINKINNLFKNKKKNVKYTDYFLFIDEYFIYFCKDVVIFTSDQDKRRIGSAVSFYNINKIVTEQEEDNNLFKIKLDIKFRNETHNKSKEFFIEIEHYTDLMIQINNVIKEYDINCNVEKK